MVPLVMKEELNIVMEVPGLLYSHAIPLVKELLISYVDNWDL